MAFRSEATTWPIPIAITGLNSGGRTGNRHKTIHSGLTFVRIQCFANCIRLTKKRFLLRICLRAFLSLVWNSFFLNSSHSTNEFSIRIRKLESTNCALIAPAPIEISRFRNGSKPRIEKKDGMLFFPDWVSSRKKPLLNRNKVGLFVMGIS
jgi:hypothetical protein